MSLGLRNLVVMAIIQLIGLYLATMSIKTIALSTTYQSQLIVILMLLLANLSYAFKLFSVIIITVY